MILVACVASASILSACGGGSSAPAGGGTSGGTTITAPTVDFTTDKAAYQPGETVHLRVHVTNPNRDNIADAHLRVTAQHLGVSVGIAIDTPVTLPVGDSGPVDISWTPPTSDYQGYDLVVEVIGSGGTVLSTQSGAVDVSSNWLKFPRYGYISGYGENLDTKAIVEALNAYHLNGLQFYDWQWKHQRPLKGDPAHPDASWNDIANRPVSRYTVQNFIRDAHAAGMVAMNYNLIYGASDTYAQDGVGQNWGLFDSPGGAQWSLPMPSGWATSAIYLFNPANTVWQNYLFDQEDQVFKAFAFDGWHADTVGDWGTKYDATGQAVSITTTFRPFLTAAKAHFPGKFLVMNPVGNKGHLAVNTSPVDAIYTEIWPWDGFPDYAALKDVADQARGESGGKSLIMPAYMNYDFAKTKSDVAPGTFNTPGILLTEATVLAAGASRLELGDDTRMLCSEYFPNRSLVMSAELKARLRRYYDFAVAYENLLRDGQSNTNQAVSIAGYATSPTGEANHIWAFTKSDASYEIVHLVNLLGLTDTAWADTNATQKTPTVATNLTLKYYTVRPVHAAFVASPDFATVRAQSVAFSTGNDAGGTYVTVTLPRLEYWDMVYFK